MCYSSSGIQRGKNSSIMLEFRSNSSMEFIHETQHRQLNLKKWRVNYRINQPILNFSSSKFSSSSLISGNENSASLEINELIGNKYYSAWRRRRRRIMSSPKINKLIENKNYSGWRRRRRRLMSSYADVEKSNPSVPKHVSQHGFLKEEVVRRSCSDGDGDRHKYCGATAITVDLNKSVSVWSPAQIGITEQQRNKVGSGSNGEKGGVGVSDIKYVHVGRLKNRFTRIIVKSAQLQEEVYRSNYLKLDGSLKMQVDKQILMEKKKLKEAQIAAEAESKMELQRKREAARKVLVELERSVEVNDNMKTMKDFAVLLGYP